MSARMSSRPAPRAAAQRGFILVTGMLFLVVMTLLALAMFRGTGLMDRISANARDKQRSFEAAQSALQYAEWWLNNHPPGTTTGPCNTGNLISGDTVGNIHVCAQALPSDFLTAMPWPNAFTYTPPNLAVLGSGAAAGGQVTSGDTASDVIYYKLPGFYLEYVGVSSTKGGNVYRITAYGYGGDANTMSIVRSTYRLPSTYGTGSSGGGGLGGP
jgi:type IV pilus assembly protein PilX